MQKVQTFEDIQRLISNGSTIGGAIREAISQRGQSSAAFALEHGVPRAHLSKAINGSEAPTSKLVAVMIDQFGGTEIEWRILLHEAGRPAAAQSAK